MKWLLICVLTLVGCRSARTGFDVPDFPWQPILEIKGRTWTKADLIRVFGSPESEVSHPTTGLEIFNYSRHSSNDPHFGAAHGDIMIYILENGLVQDCLCLRYVGRGKDFFYSCVTDIPQEVLKLGFENKSFRSKIESEAQ